MKEVEVVKYECEGCHRFFEKNELKRENESYVIPQHRVNICGSEGKSIWVSDETECKRLSAYSDYETFAFNCPICQKEWDLTNISLGDEIFRCTCGLEYEITNDGRLTMDIKLIDFIERMM